MNRDTTMQNCQQPAARATSLRPSVDIISAENEVRILADLPGVEAQDIELNFERGVLELFAKGRAPKNSRNALREESSGGDYRRSFRLSEDFDGSKTEAQYHDGVLVLRIPKAAARTQRVQIRAGQG